MVVALCAGCSHGGHKASVQPNAPAAAPVDPVADMFQKMRTANYQVDSSIDDVEGALDATKKLAPKAGDQAGQALLNVADLLNTAGEKLSEFDDVPDSLDEFRKDFSSQDEHRLQGIETAISALKAVRDASDILDVLTQNVPADHKKELDDIVAKTGEAESDLEQAVGSMGGKVPPQDSGTQ